MFGKLWKEISYNILTIYCVLVKDRFATSKMGRDIYYNKLCARVVERLKTKDLRKSGNIGIMSELGGDTA